LDILSQFGRINLDILVMIWKKNYDLDSFSHFGHINSDMISSSENAIYALP